MQKSLFIVSLDFELLWGVRDKRTIASYGANILGARKVVPALLDLFDRYEVGATFATVGFLMARDRDELLHYCPQLLPQYEQERYSPYANDYLKSIGKTEKDDPYHFGCSLVERILQHPAQELATHTFSHYYCLEGASSASFRADLQAAKNIAGARGAELKSIVFPRNQYSQEHLQICLDEGLIAYRGNETSSVYQPRKNDAVNPLIRATRLGDTYLNLTGHHSFAVKEDALVNLPASRFLRPYSKKLAPFENLRQQRICAGMTHAAKNGEGYHIWWHPHNFGLNQEENLRFLESILQHYRRLHETYGMQSKTMAAVAAEIKSPHVV